MNVDKKLPLHCSLDELLEGGVEAGIITEIYGEGGTGKTNICIQAAKSCVEEGKKVIYIDTEGISKERLLQVFKDKKKLEKILFFFPFSLKEQEEMVEKAVKIDAGLIILDSANLFYRLEMHEDEANATRSLTKQLVLLQIEARKKNIPVIITSQVYSAGDDIKPFAGRSMDHIAKTIIKLEKVGNKNGKEERKATIIKHRSIPEGKSINFFITQEGIE
ncbi:MAG TPA: DNA repair and recombination protein RadB [Thermoplasmatales archaeon]|nr:DNA repair and recombination protein RadB [Thermoplasmatales archaeon]